ncbi:MAG TPA: hypothetical protein VFO55_03815 [Gemmatimonadaceae bacterium]|nr:hypothetical protein [Gemmatimonadaceae bacterium]
MKRTTILLALALGACSHDPLEGLVPGTGPAVSDTDLRMLVQPSGAWAYFRNVSTPIARASTSPHPEPFIRVRYNAFAATQLDAGGFVKTGAVFPDSSVIVKELSDGATVSTLAVMMKLNGSRSAGFGGWIWAEYTPAGTVRYSTTERGGACSSCHARGIDYTRMNDTHP